MPSPSLILGIDTSCDETSAAIIIDGNRILANIISSQVKIHQPHGGVVPELASRSHLPALPIVVKEALTKANVGLKDLTGIAVTATPGLIGCLLVGLSYAKSLAYSLKIPFTTVHHLKGHLFSPFIEKEITYPFLGLVVSGGHTALYYVSDFNSLECLGQTVDDAAGEAYDKVAKLLDLGYPGGPLVDKLGQQGRADSFTFTRARVRKGPYFYSFSGLKTAVLNLVKKEEIEKKSEEDRKKFIMDLTASFQKEVVGALLDKVEMACDERVIKAIGVSGGVACNSLLRKEVQALSVRRGIPAHIPSPLLCTDNGAMIAYVGAEQLKRGQVASLDANAYASLPITAPL